MLCRPRYFSVRKLSHHKKSGAFRYQKAVAGVLWKTKFKPSHKKKQHDVNYTRKLNESAIRYIFCLLSEQDVNKTERRLHRVWLKHAELENPITSHPSACAAESSLWVHKPASSGSKCDGPEKGKTGGKFRGEWGGGRSCRHKLPRRQSASQTEYKAQKLKLDSINSSGSAC